MYNFDENEFENLKNKTKHIEVNFTILFYKFTNIFYVLANMYDIDIFTKHILYNKKKLICFYISHIEIYFCLQIS